MTKSSDLKVASGWFVLAAGIVLPLAIGLIFGAGAGWLFFAILLVLAAFHFGNLAKVQEAKEKGASNEQPPAES